MQYFDHSTDAATDTKIMALRLECGGAAVDAYWYILEQIHRDESLFFSLGNASALRVHCHVLCTDEKMLEAWLEAMVSVGLFVANENGDSLVSQRAANNIKGYHEKKEKASSAAKARWDNADAKQPHKRTQCKRNANPMPTKQNKTKVISALASTNKPNTCDGATAANAAPPPAGNNLMRCKMDGCSGHLLFDPKISKFRCNLCKSTFSKDEVFSAKPKCPLCESDVTESEDGWDCPICGQIKAPKTVAV